MQMLKALQTLTLKVLLMQQLKAKQMLTLKAMQMQWLQVREATLQLLQNN
jgi:hypothetical protein